MRIHPCISSLLSSYSKNTLFYGEKHKLQKLPLNGYLWEQQVSHPKQNYINYNSMIMQYRKCKNTCFLQPMHNRGLLSVNHGSGNFYHILSYEWHALIAVRILCELLYNTNIWKLRALLKFPCCKLVSMVKVEDGK